MAKITLHLLNLFQLKIKKNAIEYNEKTVGDVISKFLNENKDKLDNEFLSKNGKKLNKQMIILLNGRNINFLKKYKTELKEGDELFLSVPLAGG